MHTILGNRKKGKVVAAAAALLVLLLVGSSLVLVPAGCSGVVTICGAVDGRVLSEGLHWKLPIVQDVVSMDNHILRLELPFTSACADYQMVCGTVSVSYRIRPERSAFVYQTFGKSVENTLVLPSVPAGIKATTARYSAEELLSRLESISEKMKQEIHRELQPYGLSVEALYITELHLADEPNTQQNVAIDQTAQQVCAEADYYRYKRQEEQNSKLQPKPSDVPTGQTGESTQQN